MIKIDLHLSYRSRSHPSYNLEQGASDRSYAIHCRCYTGVGLLNHVCSCDWTIGAISGTDGHLQSFVQFANPLRRGRIKTCLYSYCSFDRHVSSSEFNGKSVHTSWLLLFGPNRVLSLYALETPIHPRQ